MGWFLHIEADLMEVRRRPSGTSRIKA
jgi:hypothetical protein